MVSIILGGERASCTLAARVPQFRGAFLAGLDESGQQAPPTRCLASTFSLHCESFLEHGASRGIASAVFFDVFRFLS